ncbi:hypothetical protein [uncultured Paraglaciecola sp.]|uniref:hypothetical protein n=1 Tax=uncultured Paraglaciecola sp. TaxID=1765024 RepID=UPI002626BCD8|nr:hypothetical protein [uncultured Paraglaciecola sp.]
MPKGKAQKYDHTAIGAAMHTNLLAEPMEFNELLGLMEVASAAAVEVSKQEGWNCNLILQPGGVKVSIGAVDETQKLYAVWADLPWLKIIPYHGNLIVHEIGIIQKQCSEQMEAARVVRAMGLPTEGNA